MGAYVLSIDLSGCRGIRKRLSWAECDGVKPGWSRKVAWRGLMRRLEVPASDGFWPDETGDLGTRRSTGRG